VENGQWKMENPLPIRGTIAERGKWGLQEVDFCGISEVGFLEKRGSLLRSERASRGYGKSPLTVASSSHVIFCRISSKELRKYRGFEFWNFGKISKWMKRSENCGKEDLIFYFSYYFL